MNQIIKKRVFVFVFNLLIVSFVFIGYCNSQIMPIIMRYSTYECNNIISRLVNQVVSEDVTEQIKNEILIVEENENSSIEFNTAVLNSISAMAIKKMQFYLYKLEKGELDEVFLRKIGIDVEDNKLKKGIIYELPFYRVFNNILLGNIGLKIPVRFNVIGQIEGRVVSRLKEYGINNALLEINLEISSKTSVSIPILSNEEEFNTSIPLIIKNIEGEIPDFLLGTHVVGGNYQ